MKIYIAGPMSGYKKIEKLEKQKQEKMEKFIKASGRRRRTEREKIYAGQ